jgi:hypothetical protein
MTSLSDAWSIPDRASIKKIDMKPNEPVDAYNSNMSYDEYVINVDSFKPFRIDVSIKNPELVNRLKHMSATEQVELVTNLLLDYFDTSTSASRDIEPRFINHELDSRDIDSTQPSTVNSELQMIIPNSTPNSTNFLVQDPESSKHVEFMKANGANDCNSTVLLIVLIFAIWMLLDRLMNIM